MDPAEIIHHLSKLSYDAVRVAQLYMKHRPRFRSPYKDGWSPEAMAHMAHLRALVEIRRHIHGFQKRKWKANSTQYSADIKTIVKKWKQAVMNKDKEIEKKEMEGEHHTIQRRHLKDSKEMETGSNGQGKENRKLMKLMDITRMGPQQLLICSQIQI